MSKETKTVTVVDEVPKAHVSFSRFDTLTTCSLKHHLKYDLGIRDQTSPNLFFGTAHHKALEELHKNITRTKKKINLPDLDFVLETFSESWAEETMNNDIDFVGHKVSADELHSLGINLLTTYLTKGPKNDELKPLFVPPIGTELGFQIPLMNLDTGVLINPDYELMGKIDLVLDTDRYGLIVIDHKTSRSKYPDYKIKLGMQLTMYAYAVRYLILTGVLDCNKPKEDHVAYNVFLKYKTKPEVKLYNTTRVDEDMLRFYRFVENALRRLAQKDNYFPEEGMHCSYCEFKEACQVFGSGWFDKWVAEKADGTDTSDVEDEDGE